MKIRLVRDPVYWPFVCAEVQSSDDGGWTYISNTMALTSWGAKAKALRILGASDPKNIVIVSEFEVKI